MKTKKEEVIFCVGLLIVLINAVTSELLTSTDALLYIPEYTRDVENSLSLVLINADYPIKLYYKIDNYEDEIERIRFETDSSARENSWLRSDLWGGKPGLQVHGQEGGQYTVQQYIFDGMEIDLEPIPGTEHSLMRFKLTFYDDNPRKILVVKMMIIAKPRNQAGRRMAEHHEVYYCNTFKTFQELLIRMRSGQIPVNLADDFPWIQDVLNRAKLTGVTEEDYTTEWYYAGAIMVNRDIISGILRLDPRWVHHIPN